MGKEISTLGDIEIEKKKKATMKVPFFRKSRDWDSIRIKQDFFGEKNYKNINGYLYNDYKVKSLHIMLPKTRAYVKSYDWQTKWMYFKLSGWKWLLNRKM